jgi:glycosyltransferase EpsD
MKKILLTATVQSHICQFHKPLVRMLREYGDCEIHVAARNNLAEKNGLALDFVDRVYDVPFERSPFSPRNLTAYKELKRILAENEYDYIHCNTPVGGIVTRLAARKLRKKGTKVFYTAHGFHFYKGAPKKNWILYYPVERWLARYTDKLITINREDYELAQKKFACDAVRIHGVGVSAERYHPVSPEEAARLKSQYGFGQSERLILCVGELLPNKNQNQIISAMPAILQAVPNARLLLAGNGPQKENLEALAASLGVSERVTFLGYCTVLEDYQRFTDVGVSCSFREGLPVNLIEAMLNRNPMVATVNRGHRELVAEGENGYLVQPGDTARMAEAVISILNDPREAERLGDRGYEMVQPYTVPVVQEELKRIYFDV